MELVELIGRLLFAAIFVMSGATIHLLKWREGVEYARGNAVPAPELLVPLSGVMAVGGGLLVALGIWADLGALVLAAFALPVAYFMHAFWKLDDPMMRSNQQAHFMKNVSMAGAALALFALYRDVADDLWMITGPLF